MVRGEKRTSDAKPAATKKRKTKEVDEDSGAMINNDAIQREFGFKMKKLKRFPIESLHYDLKLDLLNVVDGRELFEMIGVNEGFREMVLAKKIATFRDSQVDTLEIHLTHLYKGVRFHRTIGAPLETMNFEEFFVSCNWILSCRMLRIEGYLPYSPDTPKFQRFLGRLLLVNHLSLSLSGKMGPWKNVLTAFNASITRSTRFDDVGRSDNKEFFAWFVEQKLGDCPRVIIGALMFNADNYWESLASSRVKSILISRPIDSYVPEIVEHLIRFGIPSSFPTAKLILQINNKPVEAFGWIVDGLQSRPTIRLTSSNKQQEVAQIAKVACSKFQREILPLYDNNSLKNARCFQEHDDGNRMFYLLNRPGFLSERRELYFFAMKQKVNGSETVDQ